MEDAIPTGVTDTLVDMRNAVRQGLGGCPSCHRNERGQRSFDSTQALSRRHPSPLLHGVRHAASQWPKPPQGGARYGSMGIGPIEGVAPLALQTSMPALLPATQQP